jgi:hypothetical protein
MHVIQLHASQQVSTFSYLYTIHHVTTLPYIPSPHCRSSAYTLQAVIQAVVKLVGHARRRFGGGGSGGGGSGSDGGSAKQNKGAVSVKGANKGVLAGSSSSDGGRCDPVSHRPRERKQGLAYLKGIAVKILRTGVWYSGFSDRN